MSQLFLPFLSVRVLMAFLSWCYFAPDEQWQCTEIAHKLVFGYGYKTWEWSEGIRSYVHPLMFAWILQVLKWLHIDTPYLVMICKYDLYSNLTSISFLLTDFLKGFTSYFQVLSYFKLF